MCEVGCLMDFKQIGNMHIHLPCLYTRLLAFAPLFE